MSDASKVVLVLDPEWSRAELLAALIAASAMTDTATIALSAPPPLPPIQFDPPTFARNDERGIIPPRLFRKPRNR